MTLAAGTRLGRYEIRSKIGAGGMGEVYLAKDTKLKRKVAVKFLAADYVAREISNRRLMREARAAATLDHPNICAIHEVGEENGRSFAAATFSAILTHEPPPVLRYAPEELQRIAAPSTGKRD